MNFVVSAALGAIAAILIGMPASAEDQAQPSESLRALLIEYRCPVVDRLERVYTDGLRASQRNRFLAITVPEHPHGYVQCMFVEKRSKLLCEASSGFYFDKPGQPRAFRLSREAMAALTELGFSTDDSKGNFQIMGELSGEPDLNALADFMLETLHEVYGARATSKLRFNAPLAKRATSKCVPVS